MTTLDARSLFALTDDGAGGWLQTCKRRLKFLLRFHRHRPHMEAVHGLLERHRLQPLLQAEPGLMLRPWRSYLWRPLCRRRRSQALLAHLDWAAATFGSGGLLALYQGRALAVPGLPVDGLELLLMPSRGTVREGELTLELRLQGEALMRAAFSVVPAVLVDATRPPQARAMVVGNLQGLRDSVEGTRLLAQRAERLRPQALLIAALQGLASGWGLALIAGVGRDTHAFAAYRGLSRRILADYDRLWEEHDALPGAGHWRLPEQPHCNLEQIPSRKRSAARRRHALRLALHAACWHFAAGRPSAPDQAQALAAMDGKTGNR